MGAIYCRFNIAQLFVFSGRTFGFECTKGQPVRKTLSELAARLVRPLQRQRGNQRPA